jgi:hypothetical protein
MSDLVIWSDFYRYKKFSVYDKLMNHFRIAGDQKPVCFVDYSQTVLLPKRALIYEDIKNFWAQDTVPEYNKSFEETLDNIVTNIINKVTLSNKKLAVWYSGGTDSLALLSAILKNSNESFKKEKLLVRLTNDSITEYPWFYEKYINNKLNFKFSKLNDYFDNEYYNVDGVFGDTVFGEHYIPELIQKGYLSDNVDWLSQPVERFEEVLNSVLKNHDMSNWLYSSMETMFKKYKANTVFDAFWLQGAAMNLNQLHWMPFTLSYPVGKIDKETIKEKFLDHYETRVFSHPNMFLYAFNHRRSIDSNIYRARISSHKYSLDFSKDLDYYDNKIKVSSQIKMYDSTPFSSMNLDFTIDKDIIYRI